VWREGAHSSARVQVLEEASQERLLAHAAVALDRLVDLFGGHRALLRHEECDQRELPHKLVVVPLGHSAVPPVAALASW
jgi:hypothetical protein